MRADSSLNRWLEEGQKPTMPFVIRTISGRRGEAISPFHLCNLLFCSQYTEYTRAEYFEAGLLQSLQTIAKVFTLEKKRVMVYDRKGRIYDNWISEGKKQQVSFVNMTNPIIFDGYNPYTAICSLIKENYIQLWEKPPVFSEQNKVGGCASCSLHGKIYEGIFCKGWYGRPAKNKMIHQECYWFTNNEPFNEYRHVEPDKITMESWHFSHWLPITERNFVHELVFMDADQVYQIDEQDLM